MPRDADYEKVKEEAVAVLKKVDPYKPYGTLLYNAIARLNVSTGIEVFVFQKISGGLFVWMIQRAADDPFWPNQWHIPGSMMRPGEKIEDVFNRLSQKEFGVPLKELVFRGIQNRHGWVRGHEVIIAFTAELTEGPQKGSWFHVEELNQPAVINIHWLVVPDVIAAMETGQPFVKNYLIQ